MSKDKEILIIQNFGPIKDIKLELKKFNVLIGEQATGKSTVAKVLCMCRYFSYIIDNKDILISRSRFIDFGLSEWNLKGFENKNTFISYENNDYSFNLKPNINKNGEFESFSQTLKPKSERFKNLIKKLNFFKVDKLINPNQSDSFSWELPYDFLTTDVKKVMNNPFYFPTERGLQSIFSLGKSSIQYLSDSLFTQLADLFNISMNFINETKIEPLNIFYKNENGKGLTRKENETVFYKLSNGASGYKSIIPIILAIKHYNLNKNRHRTFIVEEPEQNLFPTAQKKLVEFLVKTINESENQFILPTHSPYILTTLSNLIYAYKIGTINKGKYEDKVNDIISKKSWIDVEDIAVYYLNDGVAKNMVNVKECIINLDNVSEIINNEFDKLLTIETQND